MAIPTIDVPVALIKAELVEKEPYRGALNATAMHLNGTEYAPCTVVFVGFAGGYNTADAKFHGHYKFRMAQPSDTEKNVHDLRVLPQWVDELVTTDTPDEPEPVVPAEPAAPETTEATVDEATMPTVEDAPKPYHKRRRRTKESS